MLPEGTESPWREREIGRMMEGSHNRPVVEEPAFPGVSLKKKVFSVPQQGVRKSRVDSLAQVGTGEGKQKKEYQEYQMEADGKGKQRTRRLEPQKIKNPAGSAMPTANLPGASRAIALKTESVPANLADLSPSGGQSTASELTNDIRTFKEFVRTHNSNEIAACIAASIAAAPEEDIEKAEKLCEALSGIKINFSQWKSGAKK
jgi:hypothetical protein